MIEVTITIEEPHEIFDSAAMFIGKPISTPGFSFPDGIIVSAELSEDKRTAILQVEPTPERPSLREFAVRDATPEEAAGFMAAFGKQETITHSTSNRGPTDAITAGCLR